MKRIALVVAATLALASPAAAQCPKTTLGDIEDEVMCPVCGTPLSLATEAPQAERQRELIQRLIADCRSKEQIKTALVAEFGEGVLALPDDEGFDLAAYVVPAIAAIVVAGALGFAALRWRRRPRAVPAPPAGARARLDEDMDRYDL
ncbi:MAG TPA: cytochrome c-type biogenesis protein CcmH [Thermoleophilaceae bacterium]|nr:cytochrome c-type biogenesis protein CcmH [Thermoleophilaceae bacterium]